MGNEDQKVVAITAVDSPREIARPVTYRQLYDAEALNIIRSTKCPKATDEEFGALMMIAAMKNLNPLTGQIHFVARKTKNQDTGRYEDKWAIQVGIDGLRLKAVRTGDYDGQDEPEFIYDSNGKLDVVKVRAYRKGISRPFVGIAHYDEYVQTYKDNGNVVPNSMWSSKPHIMLSKCSEALALRKAFPEELGDLHIEEELEDQRESVADRLAAQMEQGVGQLTSRPVAQLTENKEPPAREDWPAAIAAATTVVEMDDLALRLKADDSLKGKTRTTLLELYKARYKEIRSAAPKSTACAECGLDGTHAQACSKWEPPISPEASSITDREVGEEG